MPTPLEVLRDPLSVTVLAPYAALIILEALFPARQLQRQLCAWGDRADQRGSSR